MQQHQGRNTEATEFAHRTRRRLDGGMGRGSTRMTRIRVTDRSSGHCLCRTSFNRWQAALTRRRVSGTELVSPAPVPRNSTQGPRH